ncbi:MAG: hypothetical protein H0Z40_07250 [Desulfotomaculum sp.]|nr:hypothetical protein [Desulfotomaculum sp.]
MPVKIGIPRALLYYYYYPMWKEFFESLGCEVVVSDKTNKAILNDGLCHCVDEACLPVKLAFGHVLNLAGKEMDYIFIPRLVSIAKNEYICPKFLGFPDMVKHNLTGLPGIIDVTINMRLKTRELSQAYKQIGSIFTGSRLKIWRAYRRAQKAAEKYNQLLLEGYLPEDGFAAMYDTKPQRRLDKNHDLKIAVIGHPYTIYDPYISMNIMNNLTQMGARVITADNLAEEIVRREAAKLPKRLFWTLGQRVIGAGFYFISDKNVDGVINITSFACGLDSMIGELLDRMTKETRQIPLLNITLDEHTGEAGVLTRIEAFLDMVRWKKDKQLPGLGSA